MIGMSDEIYVPLEATAVITPLVSSNWQTLLAEHPDQSLVKFFTSGILDVIELVLTTPKNLCGQPRRTCTVLRSTLK